MCASEQGRVPVCAWAGEESRIQNQSSGLRRRGRQNAKTRLRKTWLPSLRRVTLRGILLSEWVAEQNASQYSRNFSHSMDDTNSCIYTCIRILPLTCTFSSLSCRLSVTSHCSARGRVRASSLACGCLACGRGRVTCACMNERECT